MRVLLQRVKRAKVHVAGKRISEIGKGYLLFVAVHKDDNPADIDNLANKVSNLRIFADSCGKLNRDIKNNGGEILSVSQFTLYANTKKGNRPGFDDAAAQEKAKECWMRFNELIEKKGITVKTGIFAQHMEVELVNDGPVTIWLDSRT
ncbi:MAG: D-tyrosyl-tRNA(Tyr) deacylase [Candidatus Omnitrophica bacterium]|nr:D-tyrosyl-tRNA(Tyr) deacylase [Candidatus Omnitrophota bacterium]